MILRRLLPLLPLLATACARDTTVYPSLAPRAVEKRGWDEPPAPVAMPSRADPALAARIDEQKEALSSAATAFETGASRVAALASAARGDAVGGERWIAAQTALADLDGLRARTLDSQGVLGQLARDRAVAGQPDDPALDAANAAADAQLDRQTQRIARLETMLPQG